MFEFRSILEEVLPSLIENVQSKNAQNFLLANIDVVVRVARLAQCENLRIAQQTLWIFERLCEAINDDKKTSSEAMRFIFLIVAAWSFELRLSRLSYNDILQRNSGASSEALNFARSRYKDVDICSPVLSDDLLNDILCNGVIDKEKIEVDLNASSFFVKVAEEPAWRTVWYGFERTEKEFDNARAHVDKSFNDREILKIG